MVKKRAVPLNAPMREKDGPFRAQAYCRRNQPDQQQEHGGQRKDHGNVQKSLDDAIAEEFPRTC